MFGIILTIAETQAALPPIPAALTGNPLTIGAITKSINIAVTWNIDILSLLIPTLLPYEVI